MKKTGFILGYIAVTFFGAALGLSAALQIGFVAVCSCVFAFGYVYWGSGSPFVAAAAIGLFTMALPIAALLFIGSPVYGSWGEAFAVLLRTSRQFGTYRGGEWLVPLLGAGLGIAVARRMRSDKSMQAARSQPPGQE